MAVSPKGDRFVTAGHDNVVKLWGVAGQGAAQWDIKMPPLANVNRPFVRPWSSAPTANRSSPLTARPRSTCWSAPKDNRSVAGTCGVLYRQSGKSTTRNQRPLYVRRHETTTYSRSAAESIGTPPPSLTGPVGRRQGQRSAASPARVYRRVEGQRRPGQGESRPSDPFWNESISWGWRFKGDDTGLTLKVPARERKPIRAGEIKYLPNKKVYEMTLWTRTTRSRSSPARSRTRA